jgi:putative membrane protein
MTRMIRLLPEALVLMALGALLLMSATDGRLALYIHPRYHLLLMGVSGALILVGALRLAIGRTTLPLPQVASIGVVLLFLALVPARPLGASLVSTKGLATQSNADLLARLDQTRTDDTRQWTLLEWTAALRTEGLRALEGKPVRLEGFIFHDPALPAGTVAVGRYLVTCCTADGRALSLVVRADTASTMRDDQWVRVEGTLQTWQHDGTATPIIEGNLTPIAPLKVPYLYP